MNLRAVASDQPTGLMLLATLGVLWMAGFSMRVTVLAIPPVTPQLQAALGLSQAGIGMLNGLPSLLFACAAIPGAALIARFGIFRTLFAGLILIAVFGALRALSPGWGMLFLATLVMSFGIAIMQPAMPPLVRHWTPAHIGAAMAVFSNGMLASEAVSSAVTIPWVLPLVDGSWRRALAFWSLPVLLALILVAIRTTASRRNMQAPPAAARGWWPDWRDRQTWTLGLVTGGGSAIYFGVNAFIPGYFKAIGQEQLINEALAAINLTQIVPTIVLLFFARHLSHRRSTYAGAGFLATLGVIGLVTTSGSWQLASIALIGFSCGATITLGLALPALLTTPGNVHRLAGAMFTIGYGCAVVVPVIGGLAWDVTGIPIAAFVPALACGLMIMLMGMRLRVEQVRPAI